VSAHEPPPFVLVARLRPKSGSNVSVVRVPAQKAWSSPPPPTTKSASPTPFQPETIATGEPTLPLAEMPVWRRSYADPLFRC